MRHPRARLPDEMFADDAGKPQPEEGQRQPRGHLIGNEPQGEQGEEGGHQHARQTGGQCPYRRRPGDKGGTEPGDRPHHHHALHPEIEYAGPLGDEFAEGGDEQWRGGGDDRQNDLDERAHAVTFCGLAAWLIWMR